jgi:hypothetical protein
MARQSAVTLAAVFVAAAATLGGCTGISVPRPTPTSNTSSTSSAVTSASVTPTPVPTARESILPRYDVSTLIGPTIYDFPIGHRGPHGGVLLAQAVGVNTISVSGASGPVSMYIPCCTDFAHLMLDYQIGSTRLEDPTQIAIGEDQGIVLDGRLMAIHAIMPVGSQPRVQAQVIVFPASAAAGLPVVK